MLHMELLSLASHVSVGRAPIALVRAVSPTCSLLSPTGGETYIEMPILVPVFGEPLSALCLTKHTNENHVLLLVQCLLICVTLVLMVNTDGYGDT